LSRDELFSKQDTIIKGLTEFVKQEIKCNKTYQVSLLGVFFVAAWLLSTFQHFGKETDT